MTELDKKRIIDMYVAGCSMLEISKEIHTSNKTIKKIVVEAGVFDPSRVPQTHTLLKRPAEWIMTKRVLTSAVKEFDIETTRVNTKIGDVFYIRTEKGDRERDPERDRVMSKPGVVRKVKVIDTSNKRFCIVALETGVTDCILWSDIFLYNRENKKYID